MKKNQSFILLLLLILNISCSINGDFKGLYGYQKKTLKENPTLFCNEINTNCNSVEKHPKIIITNGQKLKERFKNDKYTIVYIWPPKCHSKSCVPLELIQKKCDSQKINLFIVAEYYDNIEMSREFNLKNFIFGIDTQFYKTSVTQNYLSKFLYDLTSQHDLTGKYLFFKEEKFVDAFSSLEMIEYLRPN